MAKAAPRPWDWEWRSANASGGGHIYLRDAKGRRIGVIWGGAEEKVATADLILNAVKFYDEAAKEKVNDRDQLDDRRGLSLD